MTKDIGGCLIWLRQTDPIETDMSETRGLVLILIWLRHLNQSLDRYDWDTKFTVDTDMTETPRPKLAQIWLRRPKIFKSLFLNVSQSQVCRIKKRKQKIFWVSQSYLCKFGSRRLDYISLSGTFRVSHISVSFGLFWRINYGWFQTWFLSKEIRKNCFSGPFFQKKMFQKFWFSDFLGIKSEINE